ncbi:hypothetical protein FQN57_005783 [Myotisia sp. PD_48]|nr:hypothetical protein FQN57_005783 [Myotisia sp. PD_48]
MSTKRRATQTEALETPLKEQKRRRYSCYTPETSETPEETTDVGLRLLDQIKKTRDKHGQLIATEFLHLPDRDTNPEYYSAVRLPVALDTIEAKLRKHKYPRLTPVEADIRRMVSNAKYFHGKKSSQFSNGERIRKIVVSEMVKLNPAYNDPNYVPFSTPIPDDDNEEDDNNRDDDDDEDKQPADAAIEMEDTSSPSTTKRESTAVAAETESEPIKEASFKGDTFQEAMEKMVSEMIRLKDDTGQEVFHPFLNLPDKVLYKEYYEIIPHPVSLRAIIKRVRGTNKRKVADRTPPFKTWAAFEEEVSYLWKNARTFNEDQSEIVEIAGELENHFNRRLAEAKKVVPEPVPDQNGRTVSTDHATPRIKLKVGGPNTPEPAAQKLTLRLPGKPVDSTRGLTPSQGRADSEALKRQQEFVKAGVNGEIANQSTPSRNLRDRSSARLASLGAGSQDSNARRTISVGASPAPTNGAAVSQAGLRPETPSLRHTRLSDASFDPSKNFPIQSPSQSLEAASLSSALNADPHLMANLPARVPLSSSDWTKLCEVRNRAYGSGLISGITINTHPALNLQHNLQLDIPASPIVPQQPITINLPSEFHLITVCPTVKSNSHRRQAQHYVTVGDQKIAPTGTLMRSIELTKYVYDVQLRTGITKIQISMLAAKEEDRGKYSICEQITVFANLLR